MRWPRWRAEAARQHERANEALAATERQQEEAGERIAEDQARISRLRRWQQENHFAERFAQALREGR